MSPLQKIVTLTRAVALDQGARRGVIFTLTLSSLIMLFVGSTVLGSYLNEHVWAFVVYWLVCAWLTVTFMMLALYDMLAVVMAGRRLRRELERSLRNEQNSSTKGPSSTTSANP